jgi:serine/threonine-protein kinase
MVGRLLAGRYRLKALLGAGGMGEVYAAVDDRLGGEVAVKTLQLDAAQPERLARLRREARAAAGLGNPHIVRVSDFHENEGEPPFIVMEKVVGVSLRTLIEQVGRLTPRRACTIAAQVLSALAAAHRAGIIHRDIKPANIIVSPSPAGDLVKVIDFGLAGRIEEPHTAPRGQVPWKMDITMSADVMGSLGFIAPEHLRGEPIDARVDVYAAGATLYQMLSGRRPFALLTPAEYVAAAVRDVPRLSADDLRIDQALVDVVARAMALFPAERYGSAEELLGTLERWIDPKVVTSGRPPLGPSPESATLQPDPTVSRRPPDPMALIRARFILFLLVLCVLFTAYCVWVRRENERVYKDFGRERTQPIQGAGGAI